MKILTPDIAVGLLSLPCTLGVHPTTGGKIQASLGRPGPYVVHDQGGGWVIARSQKLGMMSEPCNVH